MIDLKITAKRDGIGDDDGMRLEELQDALAQISYVTGSGPETRVRFELNRKGHPRSVTGQIRADDGEATGEPGGVEGQLELRDDATEGDPDEAAAT